MTSPPPDCLEIRGRAAPVVTTPMTAESNTSTDADPKGTPSESIPTPTAEKKSPKSTDRTQIRRIKAIPLPMACARNQLCTWASSFQDEFPGRLIITKMDYESSPQNDSRTPKLAPERECAGNLVAGFTNSPEVRASELQ